MTFNPKKPCVTARGRHPVEILKVLDRPDCYGGQIVGTYVDSEGEINVETWTLEGKFYTNGTGTLDLVNVLEPVRFTCVGCHIQRNCIDIAEAVDEQSAVFIVEALNVCAGVKP